MTLPSLETYQRLALAWVPCSNGVRGHLDTNFLRKTVRRGPLLSVFHAMFCVFPPLYPFIFLDYI